MLLLTMHLQALTALDRADDLVGFRHGDLRVR
jgi:hypothetical protein